MAIEQSVEKPSRLMTFLNENNDKRVIEWVIDTVNDSSVLTNWDNVVDLGEENIETTIVTSNLDVVSQKEYNITNSSSGGNVTLALDTGSMSQGGAATLVGDSAYVPVISETAFNYSDLSFYKNGVLLQKGRDVFYSSLNVILLTNQVEAGDWIAVVKILGA